jgi:hypothetical protein
MTLTGKDDLRRFLERMITEARSCSQMDEGDRDEQLARVDDLLDKLANLDETYAFLAQVVPGEVASP